jgi:hypothetical protein
MKQPFLIPEGKSQKKYLAFIALVFICTAPVTVFCQEQQQEEQQPIEQPTVDTRPVDVNTGTLNTSPWPSNSNSADNNGTSVDRYNNTGTAARPVTGTSGTAQRPGGTVLGDTPGAGGGGGGFGNPDQGVPFDDNMNLAFLVVGLVFAFVVFKKRFVMGDKANFIANKK